MMEVKSDAIKNNIAQEAGTLGSMNQGKWEVVKQEMATVNIKILRISELKKRRRRRKLEWVNLTQMTIISTTVEKNPLEEME